MEHIKRENVLFEAYLIRNGMDPNIVMNEDKDFLKAQQKGSRKKFETLSREQKYEIANQESDALKKNIEDGRMRSDSILETLKVIIVFHSQNLLKISTRLSLKKLIWLLPKLEKTLSTSKEKFWLVQIFFLSQLESDFCLRWRK